MPDVAGEPPWLDGRIRIRDIPATIRVLPLLLIGRLILGPPGRDPYGE